MGYVFIKILIHKVLVRNFFSQEGYVNFVGPIL